MLLLAGWNERWDCFSGRSAQLFGGSLAFGLLKDLMGWKRKRRLDRGDNDVSERLADWI